MTMFRHFWTGKETEYGTKTNKESEIIRNATAGETTLGTATATATETTIGTSTASESEPADSEPAIDTTDASGIERA